MRWASYIANSTPWESRTAVVEVGMVKEGVEKRGCERRKKGRREAEREEEKKARNASKDNLISRKGAMQRGK